MTRLDLSGPYHVGFDVGYFHGLRGDLPRAYVPEVHRLLAPRGIHLNWAMDGGTGGGAVSPAIVGAYFSRSFSVIEVRPSRPRLVAVHWYSLQNVGIGV